MTHSTLEILLKKHELIDSDTLDKIRDVHLIDFMETLKKMLTLLRLFAFINEWERISVKKLSNQNSLI